MADVGLHRLLREEQLLPDLAVDEAIGNQLQDLELAGRGLLLELTEGGRRCERDHRSRTIRVPACRSRLEAAAVVAIPVQDLPPLRGVHLLRIGALGIAL